jgi:C4-dicarboxylate transporter DctQ subunit
MRFLTRAYDFLLYGLALCAGLAMAAMMITIFIDVVLRTLGFQSSAHFFTFNEYFLLLIPCLGAPWLVREKGHIYVEILLMALRPPHRRVLTIGIGVLCIAVCLVLAWYGFRVTVTDILQSNKDVRSFDMPRWMIVMWIPVAFTMMAAEFARYLWRGESFLQPIAETVEEEP